MFMFPIDLCEMLAIVYVIGSVMFLVVGNRLYRHRKILDSKYKEQCKQLERQRHELELDNRWLERKTKELERREDRILKRENEIKYLK